MLCWWGENKRDEVRSDGTQLFYLENGMINNKVSNKDHMTISDEDQNQVNEDVRLEA